MLLVSDTLSHKRCSAAHPRCAWGALSALMGRVHHDAEADARSKATLARLLCEGASYAVTSAAAASVASTAAACFLAAALFCGALVAEAVGALTVTLASGVRASSSAALVNRTPAACLLARRNAVASLCGELCSTACAHVPRSMPSDALCMHQSPDELHRHLSTGSADSGLC